MKEFKTLQANPPHGVIDVSMVSDSVLVWKVAMQIDELPFSDSIIELYLSFKPDHPYVSPSVTFVNHMFHPNVDEKTNQLCSDGKWNSVYDISAFLVTVLALLRCPNMIVHADSSPANPSAFMMLKESAESFKQSARSSVRKRFKSAENNSQPSQGDVGDATLQSLLDPELPLLLFAMPESAEACWLCMNCSRMNICSLNNCKGCGELSAVATLEKKLSAATALAKFQMESRGDTILHRATRSGNYPEVQRVLNDRGNAVDVNAVNCNLNTALHIACNFGFRDIVSLLVSVGANASMVNRLDRTPKQCAEVNGYPLVAALFEK